jgi:hypothetical protein
VAAKNGGAQEVKPPQFVVPRVDTVPQLSEFATMNVSNVVHGMRRVEGFVQRFPNDGEPATERTVAYVGHDQNGLYAAFQCFDREPARIGAHMLPRDAFPDDEDTVSVQIDTFRDLKHGYGFQVNAYGVQADGTHTEGTGWDFSWDTVWQSQATRTAQGYAVLIRIPFKSLRFPGTDVQQWGLFLHRGIARKNEEVFWPANSPRVAARWPQAAIATGIERVSPGRNVQGIPYLSSRSFRTLNAVGDGPHALTPTRTDVAFGGDAKAVVRDSIVLDGTVNPDFSQVESDLPQITVNKPFEVFFPEKRSFFLENGAYFNTPIQLLFTRRIADPLVGGRATGRIGAYAIGAMVVDDRAAADSVGQSTAWLGVARVIRDIGRESSVGLFASERLAPGSKNAVAALDARLRLGRNWFANAQAVLTDTPGLATAPKKGAGFLADLVGSGRRFYYQLTYNDRSPGFRVEDGFVPRIDVRSVDQTYSFLARPDAGALKAWGPDIVVNRTWDHDGRPLDYAITPRWTWQWTGTTNLDVFHTVARQTIRPGEVASVTRATKAAANRTGVNFQSAILPRLLGRSSFIVGDAPNLTPPGGTAPPTSRITDATVAATIRISRSMMIDASYLFDQLLDARQGHVAYSNRIWRFRLAEQFTRALAVRAIIQYKELLVDAASTTLTPERNVNYDVLLTFRRSPGTAFYIGANYNLASDAATPPTGASGLVRSGPLGHTGWQVFTKASYLLQW